MSRQRNVPPRCRRMMLSVPEVHKGSLLGDMPYHEIIEQSAMRDPLEFERDLEYDEETRRPKIVRMRDDVWIFTRSRAYNVGASYDRSNKLHTIPFEKARYEKRKLQP